MSKRSVVLVASVSIILVLSAGRERLGAVVEPSNVVNFIATDDAGPWFKCVGNGCVQAGTESLAIVQPHTPVKISVGSETNTVHTFSSLLFPEGADHMP